MGLIQKAFDNITNKKRREFSARVMEFQQTQDKNALMIVVDPETDVMVVSYKDYFVSATMRSQATGKHLNILKGIFDKKSNKLMDQFLLFLDGALFNIADQISKREKNDKES